MPDSITILVTVQPCISYIHKPASELSVAALQLMFIITLMYNFLKKQTSLTILIPINLTNTYHTLDFAI